MPDYTLNMSKCILHLRSHAYSKSHHQCAAFVKSAMAAGGLPYFPANGGDNWRVCQKLGYVRYNPLGVNATLRTPTRENRSPRNAVVGDICCVYSSGTVGHMCMYDGYQWISDFKLDTCIPYLTWWGATFWRWKDAPAGDFALANTGMMGTGGFGGIYGQMSSQEALSNAYPVHNEYLTLTGTGGNIFESTAYNAITAAAMTTDVSTIMKTEDQLHTRIYSTNDSTIVLDELSLPVYHNDDSWANKNVTREQEDEIIKKNEELKNKPIDSSIT